MSEWYYACGGKQSGPVSFEQLSEIARSGGLDPLKDLVWTMTMKDWRPAGEVSELFWPAARPAAPAADPANPYAAPDSSWSEVARITAGAPLEEIPPGSEPIDVGGCVKRGFDLTYRNFAMILVIGIVYSIVSSVADGMLGSMDKALGLPAAAPHQSLSYGGPVFQFAYNSGTGEGSYPNRIIQYVLSIFLSLGVTRIGLNIVSGKAFSVGQLFGEGRKLLPAVGATILYTLMVAAGLVLLVVPGIYLGLRYGQYLVAMVDRDMDIMESFQYSSAITANNRMNLFLLCLLSIVMAIAGVLTLCVGLFFALPVIWLAWVVAYRWMQYGHRAALDHHGTITPMLAGQ